MMGKVGKKSNLDKTASQHKRICLENNETSSCFEPVLRTTEVSKLNRKGDKNIFVRNTTNFKTYLYKCEKLLDNGALELIIHGSGTTINKATNLALQLQEIHYGCLDLDIKTSSMQLESKQNMLNDMDGEVINRQKSAIHIRIFRKIPVTALRSKN